MNDTATVEKPKAATKPAEHASTQPAPPPQHQTTQPATPAPARPPAPEGMTYNRKGELVKKRAPQTRSNKVFLVMQIVDDNGNVLNMTKRNVRIVAALRNSDKVLELLDSGEHEHAFYVKHDSTVIAK